MFHWRVTFITVLCLHIRRRKFVIQRIYQLHILLVIIYHDANQFYRLKEPFGLTLSKNCLYLCRYNSVFGIKGRSFAILNKFYSQIKMNIFCLSAFFFAFINTASVQVMKPSYRRITPHMVANRIRKHNQNSRAMLKMKLILSRKQLI